MHWITPSCWADGNRGKEWWEERWNRSRAVRWPSQGSEEQEHKAQQQQQQHCWSRRTQNQNQSIIQEQARRVLITWTKRNLGLHPSGEGVVAASCYSSQQQNCRDHHPWLSFCFLSDRLPSFHCTVVGSSVAHLHTSKVNLVLLLLHLQLSAACLVHHGGRNVGSLIWLLLMKRLSVAALVDPGRWNVFNLVRWLIFMLIISASVVYPEGRNPRLINDRTTWLHQKYIFHSKQKTAFLSVFF